MPMLEHKKILDFGNGCDIIILSATSTLSLVIGVVFSHQASLKDLIWDFNCDQRSFDKKPWLFLFHLIIHFFHLKLTIQNLQTINMQTNVLFLNITDHWLMFRHVHY